MPADDRRTAGSGRPGQMEWTMKTLIGVVLLIIAGIFLGVFAILLQDAFSSDDSLRGRLKGQLLEFRDRVEQHCGLEAKVEEDAIQRTFHPSIRKIYIWEDGKQKKKNMKQGDRIVADVRRHSWNVSVPLKLCNKAGICVRDQDGDNCDLGGEIQNPEGQRETRLHRLTLYYRSTKEESDFVIIDEINP